jgi:hypothetical protein
MKAYALNQTLRGKKCSFFSLFGCFLSPSAMTICICTIDVRQLSSLSGSNSFALDTRSLHHPRSLLP